MPQTRKQQQVSGLSGSDSQNKRKRLDEALPEDSDDELIQPKKAMKGKYAKPLKEIFQAVLEMVDKSALPYFKTQVHNAQESFEDFINWLFATHRNGDDDSFIADSEEEEEGEQEEEEDAEPELEDEEETEEDSSIARKMEEEVVTDSQDEAEVEEEEADDYVDDEEDAE